MSKSRKIQIGDLVEINQAPSVEVFKFHKHPMDVLKYLEDLHNPKLVINDPKNVPPEESQNYLVSDARDYFDKYGYGVRLCKIVGLTNPEEGWFPAASLKVIAAGS
jgi:hypothetical protein